ncbi:MAG: hypothetical protein CMK32_06845 [Porticoccaceae bacterium]|nr:hypothetical protein [Porticoccaceae bacterium]
MKKTTVGLAISLMLSVASLAVFAEDLVIDSGETFIVDEKSTNLSVDKLVIGDKAVIRFAPGVTHWELLAKDATIGYGVVIDGRGSDGADGAAGTSYDEAADACRSGKSGSGGDAGEPGARGIDIYLGMDVRKIGGLEVISDGGDGGAGGQGGQGQQAGKILNCNPAKGGNGGSGGQGGDGGDGGNVVVSLNPLNEKTGLGALTAAVRVSVKPGKAGSGGLGGVGGEGSEGEYVRAKTLTGSSKWVAGGRRGRNGAPGEQGQEGRYGQIFVGGQFTGFQQNNQAGGYGPFNDYRPAPAASSESDASEEEIRLLKEQLRVLQERMDSLENE